MAKCKALNKLSPEIFQLNSKIIFNKPIAPGHYHISLHAPSIARLAGPGQFVHIKVNDDIEPLLRRPFSIHRVTGTKARQHTSTPRPNDCSTRQTEVGLVGQAAASNIEILYKVIGKGTEILSQRKQGESLNIIGPLGNGFNYQPSALSHQPVVFVAGGVGTAPLVFLAEKLSAINPKASADIKPIVLIGAKTKSHILCESEFKKYGCDVKAATDDGSRGFKGNVTELLKKILSATSHQPPAAIYACGPRVMLKEVAKIASMKKISCQISLEEFLACGMGACLGCAVKVKAINYKLSTINRYKLVCKDGPVFDSEEILW